MDYLSLGLGLFVLLFGAYVLVRGAVSLASRLGLRALIIGLTVVGFGTSLPEVSAAVGAALLNLPGVSLGAIAGSNIANILLVLAITVLIRPIDVSSPVLARDGLAMLTAAGVTTAAVVTSQLTPLVGAVMIAMLVGYIGYVIITAERKQAAQHHVDRATNYSDKPLSLPVSIIALILGLTGVMYGSFRFVSAASQLAVEGGISQDLIGLVVIGLGTSLPELVTASIAASRGNPGLALGILLGSNIFNSLAGLGASAIAEPIVPLSSSATIDFPVMFLASVALYWFARTDRRITRTEGGVMLAAYVAFLVFRLN
ncbi:MAG: calcium/sodium antiporter [Pseudomonadota bacterium]